jgi:hypothetical protein
MDSVSEVVYVLTQWRKTKQPKETEMEKDMKDLAVKLLEEWAASMPDPNAPVLSMGNTVYSANEVIFEVRNEGDFGKLFLDSMEKFAQQYNVPLDQFLKNQIRPRPKPPTPNTPSAPGPS